MHVKILCNLPIKTNPGPVPTYDGSIAVCLAFLDLLQCRRRRKITERLLIAGSNPSHARFASISCKTGEETT